LTVVPPNKFDVALLITEKIEGVSPKPRRRAGTNLYGTPSPFPFQHASRARKIRHGNFTVWNCGAFPDTSHQNIAQTIGQDVRDAFLLQPVHTGVNQRHQAALDVQGDFAVLDVMFQLIIHLEIGTTDNPMMGVQYLV
jgi:hypothetical protein